MLDYNTLEYSNDIGAGGLQDIYALTYVDIGCRHPVLHNNTYLLEKYGWRGFAVDLEFYTPEWKKYRPNSVYKNRDAFSINYKNQFDTMNLGSPIDFLSIDLEGMVDRCNILKQVFESGYEEFLTDKGYVLVKKCEFIEDFWINPKYITNENQYKILTQYNVGEEIHPWTFLKSVEYDWTHFYNKIELDNLSEFL